MNFICGECRDEHHGECRGGTWCDCQHRSRPRASRATRIAVTLVSTLTVVTVAACGVTSTPTPGTSSVTPGTETPVTTPSASTLATICGGGAPCPDARRRPLRDVTPGALNPDVTQETIGKTICVAGWTRTIRPPASYTSDVKRRQLGRYGYADDPSQVIEDHLVPLELGGAPRDERNLWPQPTGESRIKDREENGLHDAVCAGLTSLADAQTKILRDWGPVP